MDQFTVHSGLVALLDRENVDTDAIIPKQFLKSIQRTGFGPNLFDEWRYKDVGEPGMDNSKRPLNPDFVLNQPRYQGASILLTRRNFGCGPLAARPAARRRAGGGAMRHACWPCNRPCARRTGSGVRSVRRRKRRRGAWRRRCCRSATNSTRAGSRMPP